MHTNIVMLIRCNEIVILNYVELRSGSATMVWASTDHVLSMPCMSCRCGDKIFGKPASERWSKWMQYAEGPEAFEIGYQKMKLHYAGDSPRLRFIEKLYRDGDKAHFKRALSFTNATLVDACETLFSALKTWVMGGQRTSTTLLMAVVRLAKGIQRMVMRAYLKDPKIVKRHIAGTFNASMKDLFNFLSDHLTCSAVRTMYIATNASWAKYDLDPQFNGDTVVSNRSTDDEFVVKQDYSCWSGWNSGNRCWHQVYKGFLCNHALLVCIRNITDCGSDKGARKRLMQRVVQTCNKIWHRNTYVRATLPMRMPDPPRLRSRHVCTTNHELDDKEAGFVARLREVLHFVSDTSVLEALHGLENLALQSRAALSARPATANDTDCESVTSDAHSMYSNNRLTSSDEGNDNGEEHLSYRNPRKRVKKSSK